MELTTSQDILVRGLQKIQGIVERRNTLPILSHFLLVAQTDGVVIHATDLELGYKGGLEATVNKPGTITLPARKTYDILRELPDDAALHDVLEADGPNRSPERLGELDLPGHVRVLLLGRARGGDRVQHEGELPRDDPPVVGRCVPREDLRGHGLLVEGLHELERVECLL